MDDFNSDHFFPSMVDFRFNFKFNQALSLSFDIKFRFNQFSNVLRHLMQPKGTNKSEKESMVE